MYDDHDSITVLKPFINRLITEFTAVIPAKAGIQKFLRQYFVNII